MANDQKHLFVIARSARLRPTLFSYDPEAYEAWIKAAASLANNTRITTRKDYPMNRELLQFVMFGGATLAYENSATEPSEPSNNTGPKDPPSDQSTYQDPNVDGDVLDEVSPDEPDNDED